MWDCQMLHNKDVINIDAKYLTSLSVELANCIQKNKYDEHVMKLFTFCTH